MHFSTLNLFLIEIVDGGKKSSEMQLIRIPVAHRLSVAQGVCRDPPKWTEYLGFPKAAGEPADRGHQAWTSAPDKRADRRESFILPANIRNKTSFN